MKMYEPMPDGNTAALNKYMDDDDRAEARAEARADAIDEEKRRIKSELIRFEDAIIYALQQDCGTPDDMMECLISIIYDVVNDNPTWEDKINAMLNKMATETIDDLES